MSVQVERMECRRIVIRSNEPDMFSQIDGDPGPALPLHIEVVPSAARVITPPAPPGQDYCPPVKLYHLRNGYYASVWQF